MTALDLPVATGGDSDQDRWTKITGTLLEDARSLAARPCPGTLRRPHCLDLKAVSLVPAGS